MALNYFDEDDNAFWRAQRRRVEREKVRAKNAQVAAQFRFAVQSWPDTKVEEIREKAVAEAKMAPLRRIFELGDIVLPRPRFDWANATIGRDQHGQIAWWLI